MNRKENTTIFLEFHTHTWIAGHSEGERGVERLPSRISVRLDTKTHLPCSRLPAGVAGVSGFNRQIVSHRGVMVLSSYDQTTSGLTIWLTVAETIVSLTMRSSARHRTRAGLGQFGFAGPHIPSASALSGTGQARPDDSTATVPRKPSFRSGPRRSNFSPPNVDCLIPTLLLRRNLLRIMHDCNAAR